MSTRRELLQQAADLLKAVSEKEQGIRELQAVCKKAPAGHVFALPDGGHMTKEALVSALARVYEAEIAPVKARARALQDQALAMKG